MKLELHIGSAWYFVDIPNQVFLDKIMHGDTAAEDRDEPTLYDLLLKIPDVSEVEYHGMFRSRTGKDWCPIMVHIPYSDEPSTDALRRHEKATTEVEQVVQNYIRR